jgi:hypothetical protein
MEARRPFPPASRARLCRLAGLWLASGGRSPRKHVYDLCVDTGIYRYFRYFPSRRHRNPLSCLLLLAVAWSCSSLRIVAATLRQRRRAKVVRLQRHPAVRHLTQFSLSFELRISKKANFQAEVSLPHPAVSGQEPVFCIIPLQFEGGHDRLLRRLSCTCEADAIPLIIKKFTHATLCEFATATGNSVQAVTAARALGDHNLMTIDGRP